MGSVLHPPCVRHGREFPDKRRLPSHRCSLTLQSLSLRNRIRHIHNQIAPQIQNDASLAKEVAPKYPSIESEHRQQTPERFRQHTESSVDRARSHRNSELINRNVELTEQRVEVSFVTDRCEIGDSFPRHIRQLGSAVQARVPLLSAECERDLENAEAGSECELLAGDAVDVAGVLAVYGIEQDPAARELV